MNTQSAVLNRTFIHAIVAGILLTPLSLMVDLLLGSQLLRSMRVLMRDPVSGLAFVLSIWLLAAGLSWALAKWQHHPLLAGRRLNRLQKDGLIIVLLMPPLLLMLALRNLLAPV